MPTKRVEDNDLTVNLQELAEISSWFDAQEEIDIENGLEKVKRASELIKASKKRLLSIENTFKEITRDIDQEVDGNNLSDQETDDGDSSMNDVKVEDIPF